MASRTFRRRSRPRAYFPSVVVLTLAGVFAHGTSPAQIATPTPSFAVESLNPSSGSAGAYTAVTINGVGFSPSASVEVGGVPIAPGDKVYLDPTRIVILTPILLPGSLNDVVITNPVTFALTPAAVASLPQGWLADFLDVSGADPFHPGVEAVFRNGITAGCGAGNYCRNDAVRRDQMAVFLLKSEHGSSYAPPSCTGVFTDVPCPGPFTDWIEQLSSEGITGGCGDGIYCPSAAVNRAQMAVFLLKTKHGVGYAPPPCAAIFSDVPCPSGFADWVEELYAEGVTGGCYASPLSYCPNNASTRGQMAVFLSKAFGFVSIPPTPTPTPTWNPLTPTPTPAPPTPTPTPNAYPGYWAVQPGIYVPCTGIKPFLPFVNPADGQIYYLGGDVNANMPHPNHYGTYIDAIYYNHTRAYVDAQGFITPIYRENGPPNWYPAPSDAAQLCTQWVNLGNNTTCPGGSTSWYTNKFMANEVWLLSYQFYQPSIQAACGN
ncbi:MAG TPA: IPT/TIG domain-containing protein [Thermoanaerobaculia bacterium]|nr:IPT/TIG domain-containing protein [Thermoanaerobaculia bacterium]